MCCIVAVSQSACTFNGLNNSCFSLLNKNDIVVFVSFLGLLYNFSDRFSQREYLSDAYSRIPVVSKSHKRFTLKLTFSILTEWSVFKNKRCKCSLSNIKFVDVSKLVTGPFKTQPNLDSTATGSLFLLVFVFSVNTAQ